MFSNLTIGFLVGAGFGAWVYSKTYRSTGGSTKSAGVVAAISGLFAMMLVATLLGIFFKAG